MTLTRILLFCAALWFMTDAHAQIVYAPAKYSTKNKKAIKYYESARQYFRNRDFDKGMALLNKAVLKDPNFAEAHINLARNYQMFGKYDKMIEHYKATIKAAPDNRAYMGAYYTLGGTALKRGKYDEAKQYIEKFLSFKPHQKAYIKEANRILACVDYAKEGMKNPVKFEAKALNAKVNRKGYLQYFPVLTADQKTLIFTSLLNSKEGDEDLMISTHDGTDWSEPVDLSDNIKTGENEGTCSISADGKTLVFTVCAGRKSFGGCDLYISKKYGDDWTEPINMGPNVNSSAWESQPTLSADGKTLYFVSDRNKKNGKDIYVSYMSDSGRWEDAITVGNTINTTGEELSPFIHPNGKTLFFSSNGRVGYGGQDIYKTEIKKGKWSTPQNLGYPINDHNEQVSLFVTVDGKKAYYTDEERKGNEYLKSDIMIFDLPQKAIKQKSNFVAGKVFDAKTKKPISAKVELYSISKNTRDLHVNSDKINGSYLIVLTQGDEYALEVSQKGYAFKSIHFNYTHKKEEEMKPLKIDIYLDPIDKGTIFRLNNIFFATGKYSLQNKSTMELEKLVKFMKDNPKVKGEISGHTDNTGNDKTNMTLSLRRAQSVYQYLVKHGIEPARLKYKGYGSSRPDATNDTKEGRALNRRIEFKIL